MIEIIDSFSIFKKSPIDSRLSVADETARLALTWVYVGLRAFQVDTKQTYKYIGDENTNISTDWELVLTTFTTTAAPANTLGSVGDVCIDTTNKILYTKTGASTWTAQYNFQGSQITTGSGAPDDLNGSNGDLYIRDNGGVYAKAAGTWSLQFNIAGSDGADGDIYATESTSSVDLSSVGATVTIIIDTDLSYTVGQEVIVASRGNVGDQFTGIVTAYNSSTGQLDLSDVTPNGTTTNTDWDVNLTGTPGKQGKAFIHTEHDINLTQAKITTVESGAYTAYNPYSASVLNDTRSSSELTATAGIMGNMGGHSIVYDGTNWYDNGTWRGAVGPQGIQGPQGAQGIQGIQGPQGALVFTQIASGTISNKTKGLYQVGLDGTSPLILGSNNELGTIINVNRQAYPLPALDSNIPYDTQFNANHNITALGYIHYKGRNVTSIPLSSRSITFLAVGAVSGNTVWNVIGEDSIPAGTEYFDNAWEILASNKFYDKVNANIYLMTSCSEVIQASPLKYGRHYTSILMKPLAKFYSYAKFLIEAKIQVRAASGTVDTLRDVLLTIQKSTDNITWSNVKSIKLQLFVGLQQSIVSIKTIQFESSNTYYRLRVMTDDLSSAQILATTVGNEDIVIVPLY